MKRFLLTETSETLVELLHTTGGVHDALLTGVEGVRSVGDFNVNDGVLVAVSPRGGLRAGQSGTGQERLARSKVVENDGCVLGVDVRLHQDFPSIGTLLNT